MASPRAQRKFYDELALVFRPLARARRTFNGTAYATLEEANAARAAHENLLKRTFDGKVYSTIAEAYVAEERARNAREATQREERTRKLKESRANSGIGWMLLGIWRWRDYEGRSTRKEYWSFELFFIGVVIILAAIPIITGSVIPSIGATIFLLTIMSFVPRLALQIRRLHDFGGSGWAVLINLIPYVGWLLALLMMMIDSEPCDNKFGPNPKRRRI